MNRRVFRKQSWPQRADPAGTGRASFHNHTYSPSVPTCCHHSGLDDWPQDGVASSESEAGGQPTPCPVPFLWCSSVAPKVAVKLASAPQEAVLDPGSPGRPSFPASSCATHGRSGQSNSRPSRKSWLLSCVLPWWLPAHARPLFAPWLAVTAFQVCQSVLPPSQSTDDPHPDARHPLTA